MLNKKKGNRPTAEVNTGSMADIAFLLLIFFLVTTTIASDKGIPVMLPPKVEIEDDIRVKERNVFNVLINSNDMLLVEEEIMDVKELKRAAKKFITNRDQDPLSSESPKKAVISLKTDRGTSYDIYIKVRDILQETYTELRAQHVNVTPQEFMAIAADRKDPANKEIYDKAKSEYPVMISDAEPSDAGGN